MDRKTVAMALVVGLQAPLTAASPAPTQATGSERGEILLVESIGAGTTATAANAPASGHHGQTAVAYRVKYRYRGRIYTNWVELPRHGSMPLRVRLTPIYF